MGGGGGGGGGRPRPKRTKGHEIGVGTGGRTVDDPCKRLRFDTGLMSPQPAAANLTVGDVLLLQLAQQQNRHIVQAVDNTGTVVGTITSAQITDLIDCMQRGYAFVADVIQRTGATCQLNVHRQ